LIGRYAKISEKFTLSGGLVDKFLEIYAIPAVDRQFGYKRGNVSGLTSVREAPKTVFDCGGQGFRIISVLGIHFLEEANVAGRPDLS
jgi:hypothetical protein